MKNGKKLVVLLVVMMILIGCAVGGTLAWLIANSNSVENTFTVGNITLTLEEPSKETPYCIIPGTEQTKDPYVKVGANSESCWLFVQITETNNKIGNTNEKYVQWDIDDAIWEAVPNTTGVYYMLHTEKASDATYDILLDDEVTYSSDLTKDQLTALGSNVPSLTFQAYAIQSEALKSGETTIDPTATGTALDDYAALAWALIPKS